MSVRNLIDYAVANMVFVVSVIVSLSCAGILISKIGSSESLNTETIYDVDFGVSKTNSVKHAGANYYSEKDLKDSYVNSSNMTESSAIDGKHGGYGSNQFSPNINKIPNKAVSTVQADFNRTPKLSFSVDSGINNVFTVGANNTNNTSNTSNQDVTAIENTAATTPSTEDDSNPFAPTGDLSATVKHTVITDIDESQTIVCRPVVVGGLPCMCVLTMTDADGSVDIVRDSCT